MVLLKTAMLLSLLFIGALFGFFFAWVCSTMWGLDTMPAMRAIEAMNAMNASVRNGVFFAGFMGTPIVLLATTVFALALKQREIALLLGGAFVLYMTGVFLLTRLVNVEMNIALAQGGIPETVQQADAIWQAYSPKWQLYNQIRTGISGLCLVLVGLALVRVR